MEKPVKKPAVPDRQMSDAEIADEQNRSRLIGFLSLGTVFAFGVAFFALWMVQKDAAQKGGNAAALRLIDEHSGAFITSYFFFAIGALLVAPILVHLALAIKSRRPSTPKLLLIVAFAGPILVALALPAFTVAQISVASDFVNGSVQTNAQATKLLDNEFLTITTFFYRFAQLIFAIAWVMASLYAMRIGLLTKLTGYVGIAIGAASIFAPPLAAILQLFWVGSFAILLLGRPQQRPPAWVLGRVVTWDEVKERGLAEKLRENPDDFAKSAAGNGGSDDAPAIDPKPIDAPTDDKN